VFNTALKKIFGSANERFVKSLQPIVERINALEPQFEAMSDEELQAQTGRFRAQLSVKKIDDILPEAFAVVREASKRVLNMRHFDVQLIGGLVLHKGMISEMKTGEGKTLVGTLAVYLNALAGKGVHVVTVNDYLASRDAAWMGQIYKFLGLTVGCLVHGLDDDERKEAYNADITYGTNNEFGFDYLRDNLKFHLEEMVQRPFHYAIIDEVDSILIDEARTPLIISGAVEDQSELYQRMDKYIPKLEARDYDKDEKQRSVSLSEEGMKSVEALLRRDGVISEESSLYDIENIGVVHHVNQALRAHKLFTRDVDYIVKEGKVMIIDEFTGRMMEGRRYSEGLHQALEAKEHVKIQQENQTLASITYQNYFRLYPKIAGMTGTAMTEAAEFSEIYKLEVIEIPTHRPVSRQDFDDEIYRTMNEKNNAILRQIETCHAKGQPVLVGTISIERSEQLATLLKKKKIAHHVLNARYHEQEAAIIAQAGRFGAVTIATNMAGRGTDIVLGGNPEMTKELSKEQHAEEKRKVIEAGGLYVIGTERHESRRIDNQLRGRSGRQGDPGTSKFYLSLDDDLMRIFGSEKMTGMLQKLGLKDDEAIQHPWISRALEKAQQRVEARNFDIRKNILKFDDVMNDQRKVIYEQRIDLMEAVDISETLIDMREEVLLELVGRHVPEKSYAEQWDVEGLEKEIFRIFALHLPITSWATEEGIGPQEIHTRVKQNVFTEVDLKTQKIGAENMRMMEKRVLLLTLDQLWKDHLLSLDHLRQGINLRAYAQKDPLNEFKREAFIMFDAMLSNLRELVCQRLAQFELHSADELEALEIKAPTNMHETRLDPAAGYQPTPVSDIGGTVRIKTDGPIDPNDPATWGKVGRNDNCPCGSGKKYKFCHGKIT
jgi:preprotein translocase subunit SecA